MLYPKGQVGTRPLGPMQGATQIDSYTIMIMAAYMYIEKEKKSVRYERWHAHDLTSDQVRVPHQMLYAKGLSKFVSKKFRKTPVLEKLLLGSNLQGMFHNLTTLLK